MKGKLLLIACGMCLGTMHASAQQFINGGFEPTNTITACSDVTTATYNSAMKYNQEIGTATNMQLADNSCGKGTPQEGMYFGVLKYAPPSGNRIGFKLDKPMVKGTQYEIELSYKIPQGAQIVMGSIRYGYGASMTSADSLAGFMSDPPENETWKKDTLTFTPDQPWEYIWMEVTALGGDEFTLHVDAINMLGYPPAAGISDIKVADGFSIAPNPAKGVASLTIKDNGLQLPCTVQATDISGKIVLEQNVTQRTTSLNINNIPTGMLFIKVQDKNGKTQFTKLMVD